MPIVCWNLSVSQIKINYLLITVITITTIMATGRNQKELLKSEYKT